MDARIVIGIVAATAKYIAALTYSVGGEKDRRSGRIAWTLWPADELEFHPMIPILDNIAQQAWSRIQIVNHNIDVTVIKQIPESCAAAYRQLSQCAVRICRNVLKMGSVHIAEQQRTLLPRSSEIVLIHLRVHV